MPSLSGQVALVTGAGRGIGRAIAEAYAADGAAVVCTARSTDQIDEVASAIRGADGRALALSADVTRPDDMDAVAQRTIHEFGRLDIVVANAGRGGASFAPFAEWDAADVEKVMATNYLGVFNTVKPCVPHLRDDGGRSSRSARARASAPRRESAPTAPRRPRSRSCSRRWRASCDRRTSR